ncbi:MAG TPA: tetratricopeptide repeat protein [Spirochaetota bacterium]|nr:tetratricopeptide repeat protein [Spirochaetota bacterium]
MILITSALMAGCSREEFFDLFTLKSVRVVTTGEQTEDIKELMDRAKGHESEINKKIEAGDSLADVYEALGVAFLLRKNWELSIENLEKAISFGNVAHDIHRRLAIAYSNRGRELNNNSDFDKAVYHYKLALEKNPDNHDAMYGLSLVLFFEKDDKKAGIELIKELTQKKPDYYEARMAYGRMLYEDGNRNGALSIYQSMMEDLNIDSDARTRFENDVMSNINRITRELASGVADDQ